MSARASQSTIPRGRQKTLNTSPLFRVHGASNTTGTTVETSALCWQSSWQTDDLLRGHAILAYSTSATSAVNVRLCSEAQQAPSSPNPTAGGHQQTSAAPCATESGDHRGRMRAVEALHKQASFPTIRFSRSGYDPARARWQTMHAGDNS
jgi:hypothetical protein